MAREGSPSAARRLRACRRYGGWGHALFRVEKFHPHDGTVGFVLGPHHPGASRGRVEVVRIVTLHREDLAKMDTAFDDHTDPAATDVQRPSVVLRLSRAKKETGRYLASSAARPASLRKDPLDAGGWCEISTIQHKLLRQEQPVRSRGESYGS